jgi:hypothetical protein
MTDCEKIDRKDLLDKYLKKVDEISEECEWKTSFSPEEIVNILVDIIEETYKV